MDFRDYDTRLAAYALVVEDGRILLALWNDGVEREWTLPGGGVDFDETVAETAVREVREETGYEVALGRVLGVDSFVVSPEHEAARPYKSVRVVFEGRIVGGELTHEVDGTTDEARWIALADVPSLERVPLVDAALAFLHGD